MKEFVKKLLDGIITSRKSRWAIAGVLMTIGLGPLLAHLGVDADTAQTVITAVIGLVGVVIVTIMGEDVASKWGGGKSIVTELSAKLENALALLNNSQDTPAPDPPGITGDATTEAKTNDTTQG